MHVVDGKEVERGRHLGVEHVEHHGFQHQHEGHVHLVAGHRIELEGLAKEEDHHSQGHRHQHHVGDHHVVHQPGAEEDQGYRAQQDQQQLAVIERQMVGFGADVLDHVTTGEEGQQRDDQAHPAQVVGHRIAVVIGDDRRQRQRDERASRC